MSENRCYRTGSCAKLRHIDSAAPGDAQLQQGLYKVEFHTAHGAGSGVIYATCGKLRGGNSAFAFIAITTMRAARSKGLDRASQRGSGVQAAVRYRQDHADAEGKRRRPSARLRRHRAAAARRLLPRHPDPDQRLASALDLHCHTLTTSAAWACSRRSR